MENSRLAHLIDVTHVVDARRDDVVCAKALLITQCLARVEAPNEHDPLAHRERERVERQRET